ncbi:hypothetical protein GALMADRAFT_225242 [Galerina marginata CBS 339.88]|uniref:F-box domain-containing protein n=1 Tax=Galerina marginata (strain CBS 339.88) TaxID=685588 RepID=A0A067T449_GALM3|nr:hypothetical protein GALMADRAFT_225242 [Galerina marginata CBS 339.88]
MPSRHGGVPTSRPATIAWAGTTLRPATTPRPATTSRPVTRSTARKEASPPILPPIVEIQPILMDNGVLKINLQTDGQRVRPDLKTMTDNIWYIYPHAPIELSVWNWAAPGYSPLTLIQNRRASILEAHIKALYDSLDRWISVAFDAVLLMYLMQCTSWSITAHPQPYNLRRLALLNVGEVGDLRPLDKLVQEICGGNGFCDLYIGDSTSTVPWLRRSLRGICFGNLTRLEFDGFPVSAAQAHDLLMQMKNVQEFSVSDLTGPQANETYRVVNHNLRRLSLQVDTIDFQTNNNTGAVFGLLQYLCVPNLRELTLGYEDEWDSAKFAQLYASIPPNLEKLHLKAMAINERQLIKCLKLNPGLEKLILDTQLERWDSAPVPILFTENLCQRLLYNEHEGYLCPDLEKLIVRDNSIGRTNGCFSAMVENRFIGTDLREVVVVGDEPALGHHDFNTLHGLKYRGLAFEYRQNV